MEGEIEACEHPSRGGGSTRRLRFLAQATAQLSRRVCVSAKFDTRPSRKMQHATKAGRKVLVSPPLTRALPSSACAITTLRKRSALRSCRLAHIRMVLRSAQQRDPAQVRPLPKAARCRSNSHPQPRRAGLLRPHIFHLPAPRERRTHHSARKPIHLLTQERRDVILSSAPRTESSLTSAAGTPSLDSAANLVRAPSCRPSASHSRPPPIYISTPHHHKRMRTMSAKHFGIWTLSDVPMTSCVEANEHLCLRS